MNYSIKSILENPGKNKFLFFWGHQQRRDSAVSKSCFSQWWPCEFMCDGISYKSSEHYMMAEKARLFEDEKIFDQIIECKTPAEAKKLGRRVKNFDNDIWLNKRYKVVKRANFLKFSQNRELGNYLINTKNRILVEASPVDPIWGIGLAEDNRDASSPEKWKGLNLLGFALMEVRDEILML